MAHRVTPPGNRFREAQRKLDRMRKMGANWEHIHLHIQQQAQPSNHYLTYEELSQMFKQLRDEESARYKWSWYS